MENNNRIKDDCFLVESIMNLPKIPETLYISSDVSVYNILPYKQRWEDLVDTFGCKLNVEIDSSSFYVVKLFEKHPTITIERRALIE